MSQAKRMREARLAMNLSQGEVAQLLGVSRVAVTKWEQEGGNIPEADHLLKCAKIYHKDPMWLRFGDGFLEKNEVIFPASKKTHGWRLIMVPVISWDLAIKGTKAVSELPPDHKECIPLVADKEMPHAFWLRIKNDSMVLPSPTTGYTFRQPDCIAIDPDDTVLTHEKFGLFREKDAAEPIFRQLIVDGGTSYLKPLNDKYEMIKLTPDIEIIGKMVGRFTPF
jgi:SOS-response transcriptional repressor LexA